MRKLVILLMFTFAAYSGWLEARPMPEHDYMFAVTGVVTEEDGKPVKDAETILEVSGPVYKGVELIKTAKRRICLPFEPNSLIRQEKV